MMIKVSPSILSANFAWLAEEARKIEGEAEMLHFDIMDGHFVDNLTMGPQIVSALRRECSLMIFDVHLMITHPCRLIERFAQAGADFLTVHVEAEDDLRTAIRLIKSLGIKAGVAINPGTPVSTLIPVLDEIDMALIMTVNPGFSGQRFMPEVVPKITQLHQIIKQQGLSVEIEVDGGINKETVRLVVEAGADILVAGSFIFGYPSPVEAIRWLKSNKRVAD